MKSHMLPNIFVMGCERSGSTWLSNILASHHDIRFIMEPFAEQLHLFPQFPNRNVYLDSCSLETAEYLSQQIGDLPRKQYPFFYKPGAHRLFFHVDRHLVKGINWLAQKYIHNKPLLLKRHQDLSLTMYRPNSGKLIHKNKLSPHTSHLIKELRINFKSHVITQLYPDAHFIVTVRNPAGQLNSILDRMNKGSLKETKKAVMNLKHHVQHPRFKGFQHLFYHWKSQSLEKKLAIWWLINYQTLIEDLKNSGAKMKIIYHEEICQQAISHVDSLFSFLTIEKNQAVIDYVNQSSTAATQSHHDSLDTFRDSKNYYKQRIGQATHALTRSIQDVFSSCTLIPELSRYQTSQETPGL